MFSICGFYNLCGSGMPLVSPKHILSSSSLPPSLPPFPLQPPYPYRTCSLTQRAHREWLYLLSHEMFNPYYGLFEYSARYGLAQCVTDVILCHKEVTSLICSKHHTHICLQDCFSSRSVVHVPALASFPGHVGGQIERTDPVEE